MRPIPRCKKRAAAIARLIHVYLITAYIKMQLAGALLKYSRIKTSSHVCVDLLRRAQGWGSILLAGEYWVPSPRC